MILDIKYYSERSKMKNKKVYGRVTGLFPVNGDRRRGRWGSYNGSGLFYPYPDQSNLPFTHYKKVEE